MMQKKDALRKLLLLYLFVLITRRYYINRLDMQQCGRVTLW